MSKEPITLHIAGKEHKLTCLPEDAPDLAAAAQEVDRRVDVLRSASNTLSSEKAIALAALDLAFELTKNRRAPSAATSPAASKKIDDAISRLQGALDL